MILTGALRQTSFATKSLRQRQPGRNLLPLFLRLSIAIILIISILPVRNASAQGDTYEAASPSSMKLSPRLRAQLTSLPAGQKLPVIVLLQGSIDPAQAAVNGPGTSRQERVIRSLQDRAQASQQDILSFLQDPQVKGKVGKVKPLWIINALSLEAEAGVIQALALRSDVKQIQGEEKYTAPTLSTSAVTAWDNLGIINARQMWSLGFQGQGIVVASMDTGVDYTHSELQSNWRGGSDSWYDPYQRYTMPRDLPSSCGASSGHGTATTAVMVGKTVGVAPAARWIAVKIFDDNCQATTTAVLLGYQWILDPDNNPRTFDTPQVVNNSWGGQFCDSTLIYQPALKALRAAGILPVFSAGNYGPGSSSGAFPATYPEAFPVGATDDLDTIASFSSRGPNTCGQSPVIFPNVVAPGVNIYTAIPGNAYATINGTSFSAPHVAGALALLLSASPQGLTLQQQESALQGSAVDLGSAGPDNTYGYGRLDVLGAYHYLTMPKLSFTTTSGTVLENGGSISMGLQLNQPAAQPISVAFSTIGGTATPGGVDYSLPGPVTFNPGETTKTIAISITDDALAEPDETFTFQMTGLVNAVLADPTQAATVTILDNDPELSFAANTQTVLENAGSALITVVRNGGESYPVSVDYSITGGTAAAGIHYIAANGQISFAAGEMQKSFLVTVLDDGQPDPYHTLVFGLSNPQIISPSGMQTASVSAAGSQTVLTIQNTDPWFIMLPVIVH